MFSDLYRITSVTVSLVVTLTRFSHAPPAELFRGDAFCGERLTCRWEGGETAPCFPVLLIQRRRLFRDDPASRIGFRPLQQDAQPAAAAQLAGYIFDLEGHSRRLQGFAHPHHPTVE